MDFRFAERKDVPLILYFIKELADYEKMLDEVVATEEILEQAAEILVLGTTCECVAVTHYNGKPVGDGRPGPIADRLRHLLHDALVTGGVPFLE